MIFRRIAVLVTLTAILSATSPVLADAPRESPHCFFSHEFKGWKASDPNTMYIRVGADRYYRLDLATCPGVTSTGAYLITKFRGTARICRAVDWDIRVATSRLYSTACIVKNMTELTKREVDALPKRWKP